MAILEPSGAVTTEQIVRRSDPLEAGPGQPNQKRAEILIRETSYDTIKL